MVGTIIRRSTTGGDISIDGQTQGDILYFDGSDWVRLAAGTSGHRLETLGAGSNPQWSAGGDITAEKFPFWQLGMSSANSSSAAHDVFGMLNTMTFTDASSSDSRDTTGVFLTQNTAASIGNEAESHSAQEVTNMTLLPSIVVKFALGETTDKYFFTGLTDSTAVPPFNVSFDLIGLQFDTDNADGNFFWAENEGGSALTRTDTGVALTTDPLIMSLNATSATSVTATLYNDAMTVLDTATLSTDLPAASTLLSGYIGTEARANAAKSHDFYWMTVLNKLNEP